MVVCALHCLALYCNKSGLRFNGWRKRPMPCSQRVAVSSTCFYTSLPAYPDRTGVSRPSMHKGPTACPLYLAMWSITSRNETRSDGLPQRQMMQWSGKFIFSFSCSPPPLRQKG